MAATQQDISKVLVLLRSILQTNLLTTDSGAIVTDLLTVISGLADTSTKVDKLITTNRQTASYTLVLTDADKMVEMNVAGANNLTVPANASVAFPTGTQILVSQYGAGQTTFVADVGVTIRSNSGNLKLSAQYTAATLVKIGANEWYLFGSLTA